jgi:hypothetical protein
MAARENSKLLVAVSARLVLQLHEGSNSDARFLLQELHLRALFEDVGQLIQEFCQREPEFLRFLVLFERDVQPRSAVDFKGPRVGRRNIERNFAVGIPEIDLENERGIARRIRR